MTWDETSLALAIASTGVPGEVVDAAALALDPGLSTSPVDNPTPAAFLRKRSPASATAGATTVGPVRQPTGREGAARSWSSPPRTRVGVSAASAESRTGGRCGRPGQSCAPVWAVGLTRWSGSTQWADRLHAMSVSVRPGWETKGQDRGVMLPAEVVRVLDRRPDWAHVVTGVVGR